MLCTDQTTLQIFRGDSAAVAIATVASFDLNTAESILFTVKRSTFEADDQALIQKALGTGITVSGDHALDVALVPADTENIADPNLNPVWDIQAQTAAGTVHTVASGRLKISLDVTRETATSIPIYTSQPPVPGNGGSSAYTHIQSTESSTWIINHNLGFYPTVSVLSDSLSPILADWVHTSVNQTRIFFQTPRTGQARLI